VIDNNKSQTNSLHNDTPLGSPATNSRPNSDVIKTHHGLGSVAKKVLKENLYQQKHQSDSNMTSNPSKGKSNSNINVDSHSNSNVPGYLSGHKSKDHQHTSVPQNSNTTINQTGQPNSKLEITNSSERQINTKSNIRNNAHANFSFPNLLSGPKS
jgi:hypothetical protein